MCFTKWTSSLCVRENIYTFNYFLFLYRTDKKARDSNINFANRKTHFLLLPPSWLQSSRVNPSNPSVWKATAFTSVIEKHSHYFKRPYRQARHVNYLCNIHQLTRQLLNFIFTPQHTHIILIGPAVKQDTRHCGSNNWRKIIKRLSDIDILTPIYTKTILLTHPDFFVWLAYCFDPTYQKKGFKIFSCTPETSKFDCKWSDSSTRVVIVESCNIEGFRSPSAELKPNRRHWRQLGAKHLGNIVSMGIPLQDGK